MDKESAVQFLKSYCSYEDIVNVEYDEERFDLNRVRFFFDAYCGGYQNMKFVHVGGSKGKGTVCNIVAQYLKKIGHKVGMFTSPVTIEINEAFWLNGGDIPDEVFVEMVEELKIFLGNYDGAGELTYFELLTGLVVKYFMNENVDYVVFEVGLGGRLDATNVVFPVVSALTLVEEEHTEILGTDIRDILVEKLGIVKDGVDFVVGIQRDDVRKIVSEMLVDNKNVSFVENDLGVDVFSYVLNVNGALSKIILENLLGSVDFDVLLEVISNLKIVGRFDYRQVDGKDVVFDMAHTVSSVKALVFELKRKFPDKSFVFLVSIMQGKNVCSMLEEIFDCSSDVFFTNSHDERGFSTKELVAFAREMNVDASGDDDYSAIYRSLLGKQKKDQVLVVTGSHFLIGKILSL